MLVKKCQLCQSPEIRTVIDLGEHPLADTFLSEDMLQSEEPRYPLKVFLCQSCGYAGLEYVVPAERRYQETDYSYTSGNSPVSLKHFSDLAEQVSGQLGLADQELVVDIGSNDGTLLKAFRDRTGCRIVGVEPSANIAALAHKNNLPTVQSFFDGPTVERIISKYGQARCVLATNVFNHSSNPGDFVSNVAKLLDDRGVFIFEVPYWLTLVNQYSFDTIYLEHVSYFAVKPLVNFFNKYNLHITDIKEIDYMGGSIRVTVSKMPSNDVLIARFIKREEAADLYNFRTYEDFMDKINSLKKDLVEQLQAAKARGEKVIGIGAATKGNTLLNFCGITNDLIDFVTDSSPQKIGKYTPGSRLPIKADDAITNDVKYAVILPWNIADFLMGKLKFLNLKFIIPHINQ